MNVLPLITSYAKSVRSSSLALSMFVGGLLGINVQMVKAAPLTFRFDATIDTVFVGIPFDSGVSFSEGDVISGKFTFEPQNGNGNSSIVVPQPYRFVVSVNGIGIASENFNITANDDSFVIDFDDATIVDQLELRGTGLSAIPDVGGTNFDSLQSAFALNLWADSSVMGQVGVLEPAYIPGDVEIWNQFNIWRNLQVILRDGEGGAVGFSALLGELAQIPEPSSACLALAAALCAAAGPRRASSSS